MTNNTFNDDFKPDAVAQITERGYPAKEVSERLGFSQRSLYAWKKELAKASFGEAEKDAEIGRLEREQARVRKHGEMCSTAWRCSTTPGDST